MDLGRGRRSTQPDHTVVATGGCLIQLSKVSRGNIDKDGRYWHGEIDISVEITSYHSRQRDYTRRYERSLKSSLHFKVEDDFENLV